MNYSDKIFFIAILTASFLLTLNNRTLAQDFSFEEIPVEVAINENDHLLDDNCFPLFFPNESIPRFVKFENDEAVWISNSSTNPEEIIWDITLTETGFPSGDWGNLYYYTPYLEEDTLFIATCHYDDDNESYSLNCQKRLFNNSGYEAITESQVESEQLNLDIEPLFACYIDLNDDEIRDWFVLKRYRGNGLGYVKLLRNDNQWSVSDSSYIFIPNQNSKRLYDDFSLIYDSSLDKYKLFMTHKKWVSDQLLYRGSHRKHIECIENIAVENMDINYYATNIKSISKVQYDFASEQLVGFFSSGVSYFNINEEYEISCSHLLTYDFSRNGISFDRNSSGHYASFIVNDSYYEWWSLWEGTREIHEYSNSILEFNYSEEDDCFIYNDSLITLPGHISSTRLNMTENGIDKEFLVLHSVIHTIVTGAEDNLVRTVAYEITENGEFIHRYDLEPETDIEDFVIPPIVGNFNDYNEMETFTPYCDNSGNNYLQLVSNDFDEQLIVDYLVSESGNFENAQIAGSVGPGVLADWDGNGTTDLYVWNRVSLNSNPAPQFPGQYEIVELLPESQYQDYFGEYYEVQQFVLDYNFDGLPDFYLKEYDAVLINSTSSAVERNWDNSSIQDFRIIQTYPNPFNSNLNIVYYLENSREISINLYNTIGQKVLTGNRNSLNAGKHTTSIDAFNLASGTYYLQLSSDQNVLSQKVILLK